MPPKGKKGKKGKKMPVLIDGVDTSAMTRDQLEAFALRLKAEMDREREERNYFQLERDKIRTYWEISRQQLEEAHYEVMQKERDMEATANMAERDNKHVQQQMKHLQFENHTKMGEARAEAMTQLKVAQESHMLQEAALQRDKRILRNRLRTAWETADKQKRTVEAELNQKIVEQHLKHESEMQEFQQITDERRQRQRAQLHLFYRCQMFEVEERKNAHIRELEEHHNVAFSQMKIFYNDITLNNLALITGLKEELENQRQNTERNERITADLERDNQRLKEPLENALMQVKELTRKQEFYDRDKQQLGRLKQANARLTAKYRTIRFEHDALKLRTDKMHRERNNYKKRFDELMCEIQQKVSLKNVILERKCIDLIEEDKRHKMVMRKALMKCKKPDETAEDLAEFDQYINEVLKEKNDMIADLRFQWVKAEKAYDDLIEIYHCKLQQYGLSKNDEGFQLLHERDKPQLYLCGPAGVAVENK